MDRKHLDCLEKHWHKVPEADAVNQTTARFTGLANALCPSSPHYRAKAAGRRVYFLMAWGWLLGVRDAAYANHGQAEERTRCVAIVPCFNTPVEFINTTREILLSIIIT